jgi:hypothetical protein
MSDGSPVYDLELEIAGRKVELNAITKEDVEALSRKIGEAIDKHTINVVNYYFQCWG